MLLLIEHKKCTLFWQTLFSPPSTGLTSKQQQVKMVYLSGLACWCWRVLKWWHMLARGWCACQNWRGVINTLIWKLDDTGERKKNWAFPPSSVVLFSRHSIHYITPILHAHHPQHFQTCQHLELSRGKYNLCYCLHVSLLFGRSLPSNLYVLHRFVKIVLSNPLCGWILFRMLAVNFVAV